MFCLICKDKPNHVQLRMYNRPAHIEYVLSAGIVAAAGPFTSDDNETMIGTMMLLNVDSRAAAEEFAANDPYAQAGLFDSVEVFPWKHLIGGLEDPNKA